MRFPAPYQNKLGDARYERDGQGDDLMGRRLTWDLPAWGHQVLSVDPL